MTWDRRLYFPSEGRRAEDFLYLKYVRKMYLSIVIHIIYTYSYKWYLLVFLILINCILGSIKMDLLEVGCGAWTDLMWLRIGTGAGHLSTR